MHATHTKASAARVSLRIVAIGGGCLLLGLTVRYFLNQAAHQSSDSPPPDRKGINAPFITTSDLVVEKMVELAELKQSDLVYDLGCGDGRIVITAAMKSGCNGIGFDIDPQRVAEARKNVSLHEVEQRVQIIEQDIFTVDLSKADVVVMYLLPWMVEKLLPQLQEMKQGCRIVSHDFWIQGVEPDDIVDLVGVKDNETQSLYVYRTPLKLNPAMERGRPPILEDLP